MRRSERSEKLPVTVAERDRPLYLTPSSLFRDGRFATAEALCGRLLASTPHFSPAILLLGMVAGADLPDCARHSPAAGCPKGRSGVRLKPAMSSATQLRTRAGRRIDRGERAADPPASNDVGAHNNLGLRYLAQRRLPDAAPSFQSAIAAAPSIPGLHLNLWFCPPNAGTKSSRCG